MAFMKRVLVGRPIRTADAEHQRIPKTVGLAVFSSDAISSTAYATEEILFVTAIGASSLALEPADVPLGELRGPVQREGEGRPLALVELEAHDLALRPAQSAHGGEAAMAGDEDVGALLEQERLGLAEAHQRLADRRQVLGAVSARVGGILADGRERHALDGQPADLRRRAMKRCRSGGVVRSDHACRIRARGAAGRLRVAAYRMTCIKMHAGARYVTQAHAGA